MRWLVGLCVRHAGTIATLTLIRSGRVSQEELAAPAGAAA